MESDHWINANQEEIQKLLCMYCSGKLNLKKWKQDFAFDRFYKVNDCDGCGKTNRVQVGPSSGHDDWNKSATIENVIQESEDDGEE